MSLNEYHRMPKATQDVNSLADTVDAARGLLEQIRQGFAPYPVASTESLARLNALGAMAPEPCRPAPQEQASLASISKTPPPVAEGDPVASVPVQAAGPALSAAERAARLATLREEALKCVRCPHLAASRTQVVFGVGNPDADLMFVGEAPGADEDAQGEPFVGRAGQLLTKIIEAMGLARSEIYIANILKCRPDMPPGVSGNRKPKPEEMATCIPWLKEQIKLIQPKAMVALGATAVEGLLGGVQTMRDTRGRWHEFEGIPVMVTYHPAYLLRNQSLAEKRKVWEDMLQVMERLQLPISTKQRNFFLAK